MPADFMQDPHVLLKKYREKGPVHEVVWAHGAKVWLVTGYDEVRGLVNDPRVSKDGRRANELFARHSGTPTETEPGEEVSQRFDDELAAHMLNSDPPRHSRLRALVSKAFTAQRVEKLRPRVEEVVEGLLEGFGDRTEVDLIQDFAVGLPITIICDLCGIPEADRQDFRELSLKLVGAGQDPEEVVTASKKMTAYAGALIDAKRATPGDDMISELVRVSDGADRLTQGELIGMIFMLSVAGHIGTTYAIAGAVANLLTHPDELSRLRADASLMSAAVDELLRFDGPSGVGTFRFSTADIPVGDTVIPAGEILALSWHSANRDSSHFPDADRLDLGRHPTGSLAFGHGVHYCIAVPLAKMQIEIALDRLLSRYPHLQLAVEPEELRWNPSALLRGLVALPVLLSPES
ncbi:MAG: cytochrome P450 [Jatrophihabitantaceae bacterium]